MKDDDTPRDLPDEHRLYVAIVKVEMYCTSDEDAIRQAEDFAYRHDGGSVEALWTTNNDKEKGYVLLENITGSYTPPEG